MFINTCANQPNKEFLMSNFIFLTLDFLFAIEMIRLLNRWRRIFHEAPTKARTKFSDQNKTNNEIMKIFRTMSPWRRLFTLGSWTEDKTNTSFFNELSIPSTSSTILRKFIHNLGKHNARSQIKVGILINLQSLACLDTKFCFEKVVSPTRFVLRVQSMY